MMKKFFIILPLIAIIDIFAQLCLYIFCIFDEKGTILGIGKEDKRGNNIIHDEDLFFIVSIDILFRYIFSRLLLKSNFYRHHILSMILNGIGFIPLIVINIKDLVYNFNKRFVYKLLIYIILNIIKIQ